MRVSSGGLEAAADARPPRAVAEHDPIRRLASVLPRPIRFLGVGGIGLVCDLAVFTIAIAHGLHPLLARLLSLGLATLVTWRLNRALTFDDSGRNASDEAARYAAVAATAQAMSYGVFALLVVTIFAAIPQLAVLCGAAAGALISYNGQALFAFRARPADARPRKPV